MIRIQHPDLPVEREVPEAALDEWLEAGWVEQVSEAATAADQGQHSDEGDQ